MNRILRRATAVVAAPLLTLGLATLPTVASAAGPETDSAVLTYNGSSWSCTFVSPDEGAGSCTVVSQGIVTGCLVTVPVVRGGGVALTEPSGESVSLSGTVVGTGTEGTFAGTGTDGGSSATATATYAGTCGHFGGLSSARISLSWTVG